MNNTKTKKQIMRALPEIIPTPSRYKNPIGKYLVKRNAKCISCGLCAKLCPYGVHLRYENYSQPIRPLDYKCIGTKCASNDFYCVKNCPQKALTVAVNPILETIGDYRWTAEMILAHWYMAETGKLPYVDLEYSLGYSGGGFDKIRFRIPDPKDYLNIPDEEIDTSIGLNKRRDGRPQKVISQPCYGGGMSFGSTSLPVLVGRARAAKRLNSFTCTGEGGYPDAFVPYRDNIITQVATGLFGVREETILYAPIVEFKYAQGAKPGLGGHLLGDKVTPEVAKIRETVMGSSLFSPFPFHSVYSVEDHKKHLDWIKEINPRALVSVKVSTPSDSDMVAVGSYYAGANIIHFDGSYGGTGAAPDIAKKNIAMPIEYAVPKIHRFLINEGVREEMCFMASGGIRNAMDVAKAIAMGADGAVIGTADLVALECVRCANCESGRGCARSIASTDNVLGYEISEEYAERRLVNMYSAWRKQWCEILRQYGMRSIRELVGRSDLLVHMDYLDEEERKKVSTDPNEEIGTIGSKVKTMRNLNEMLEEIVSSRAKLPQGTNEDRKAAEEGGCGVTGFIANIPISGKHIFEPSVQMHNRGNGKGGGIAAVGLSPQALGVTQDILDNSYMLQVALLDSTCSPVVEKEFVEPFLEVHKAGLIPTVQDYRDIKGLDVRPPDVMRYFVRVKKNVLDRFITDNKLQDLDPRKAEDEFIYQNSICLNQKFYASLGEKQAFVLSHGRNIMILKIVGYAELVAKYYLLENFQAHGWIAHQRYPTKGRVWHPGGAHPFIGLDEALVHNGDFANYHSITEYLKQYNIRPQFLTDTEVSIQLFDLWNRNFGYPLEYIIEAMAPTTEHDFDRLPLEKQKIYRYIQQNHIHCSPDGPWFFIIARNDVYHKQFQLMGITDTAMLRPQVFAIEEGEVQIGLICSEKQAIDATLKSLAAEDKRFCPIADNYWNARGGSSTDGGTFIFTVKDSGKGDGSKNLICTNKFGEVVRVSNHPKPFAQAIKEQAKKISVDLIGTESSELKAYALNNLGSWNYKTLQAFCKELFEQSLKSDEARTKAIEILTYLNDIRMPVGDKKRSWTLNIIREGLTTIFKGTDKLKDNAGSLYAYIDWTTRKSLRPPQGKERVLVINASKFQPEGDDCDARLIVAAYQLGWKRFMVFGYKGQRFTGCGLTKDSDGVRIDVYDSSGDYLASGIDGLEIYVHGNAQDQVGQIMKRGKLVIYGDVGQTFMYGAKGGEVYVMGNAAGRPLINAVGRPRIVINGTCLDYLAESFMAGDPLNGGGFVIMNGIAFNTDGKAVAQDSPYPGSNLFSLASGGAIFLRDPHKVVSNEQLNGGEFVSLNEKEWELILPYLKENERLFNIKIDDLLTVDGVKRNYADVYRKVQVVKLAVLAGKASTLQAPPAVKPASAPSTREYAGLVPEGEDADE